MGDPASSTSTAARCASCGLTATAICPWQRCGAAICETHAAPGPNGASLCPRHGRAWQATHRLVARVLAAPLGVGGLLVLAAGLAFFHFAWWFVPIGLLFTLAGAALWRSAGGGEPVAGTV